MTLNYMKDHSDLNNIRHMAMQDRAHRKMIRYQNALNKKRDKIRSENWQKTLDKFKRNVKKKGVGKTYKIKGQKLKSYWDTIDKLLD